MANTFVLIAQQPLEFKGQHYEPGDRLIADAFEAAPLQRKRITIEAPPEEQRAHGAALRAASGETPRRRGRPRKVKTEDMSDASTPTYQRRDLQAEE